MLRIFRIVAGLLIFTLISAYFMDFAGFMPVEFSWLAKIQFVPALKAHLGGVIAAILLVTFLFGRFYCSAVCPLGVLQDIISWAGRKIKSKSRFEFRKPVPFLRPVMVIVFLIGFPTVIASLLDPYSIFGRIACSAFKPIYQCGNNAMVYVCSLCGVYEIGSWPIFYVNAMVQSLVGCGVALAFLLLIGILAYRNGRTYCNTICPVGTLLGLFSRFSVFRIRIDKQKCISCGLCAAKCKSSCINSKEKTVDSSRCVDCFDCLGACKKDAIGFSFRQSRSAEESVKEESAVSSQTEAAVQREDVVQTEGGESRRQFVSSLLTIAAISSGSKLSAQEPASSSDVLPPAAPVKSPTAAASVPSGEDPELFLTGKTPFVRQSPIAPPGALSIAHLNHHCTACHLCVAKCPAQVLKPAVTEYGPQGFLQPRLEFSRGFCNYDCTVCSDVCPNGALKKITVEQKHKVQMGRVVFIEENCVVKVKENSCGACSEHCPTQAVSMVPYKNGLTIPHINPDICVGCGGCESICPVKPFKAIYVEGSPVQNDRKEYEEKPQEEIKLDDFGF